MINWEELKHNHAGWLYRVKVPGGWLVKEVSDVQTFHPGSQSFQENIEWHSSLCFVPDPCHSWVVTDRKKEEEAEMELRRNHTFIGTFCNKCSDGKLEFVIWSPGTGGKRIDHYRCDKCHKMTKKRI